jgi:NAD kinase
VYEKIVLVTRKTRLEELVARFNTVAQAQFYLEHAGVNFSDYLAEHDTYQRSLEQVRREIEAGPRIQVLDRGLVPTYTFARTDLVVTLGQDGLVANTAKYVTGQPILAVNPDRERFDGVLLPFLPQSLAGGLDGALRGRARVKEVVMAEARLQDGQRLLAFNDLFIGASTHVSARYQIRHGEREEKHSSSGILVSTGAGSTGWLSSVFHETAGLAQLLGGRAIEAPKLAWDSPQLFFVVREPYASLHSQAGIAAGFVDAQKTLHIKSQMPSGGVIFSDGVESDKLEFHSGGVATIGIAKERAQLVFP